MKKKFFILMLCVFCTVVLSAEDKNDAVFLVDETIIVGQDLFLERLGLTDEITLQDGQLVYRTPSNTEKKTPVGLVLSGGAARAFAHIGVLKKLESEGIYPDFIVTNSMGSLVGMLYAAGMSPDAIKTAMSDFPYDYLFSTRLPIDGGLIDDSHMISILYNIFGELDIKDLEIPIIVIAEDLHSRRQVYFMEGDFYKILSATIAMPVSFPPVVYNDMILIDGGVANLVPIEPAFRYTDQIITSTTFYNKTQNYKDIFSVINRALDIGKTRQGIEDIKNIDTVLIRCDVEDFSFMDFHKIDEIEQRGIESTDACMDDIKLFESVTWTPERLLQLEAKRSSLNARYTEVFTEYMRTGIIAQKDFTGSLLFGLQMHSDPGDDYFFDNSNYVYFAQKAEIGTWSGELREYWNPMGGFGLEAKLNTSLFGIGSLQNSAMFKWTYDTNSDINFDGIIYHGKIETIFTKNFQWGVRPFFSWEGYFSHAVGLEKGPSEIFGQLGFETFFKDYSVSAYAFYEKDKRFGIGLKNDFDIKIIGSLYFEQKTTTRIPFNADDTISLFQNDGLRGYVKSGSYDYFVITNNTLTFRLDNPGSLFEIILIKNADFSLFCDYYNADIHGISVGSEISIDMSVIGLVSFYASVSGGWDFGYKKPFTAFSVGSKL